MSKTRAAARRLEQLEHHKVEKPWQPWALGLSLAPAGRAGDTVLELDQAVLERGAFRLGPIDLHVAWGERISIEGPNGPGKSTLLDALLGELDPTAGTRRIGPSVVVGRLAQERSLLEPDLALVGAFVDRTRRPTEEARTLLAKFDLYERVVLPQVATLSPGEGAGLSSPPRSRSARTVSSSTSRPTNPPVELRSYTAQPVRWLSRREKPRSPAATSVAPSTVSRRRASMSARTAGSRSGRTACAPPARRTGDAT
jgi:energy-coupling factor transporter ATP-binding protein EcfA2